ncbi:acetoacetate--CoA ligase [Taklimakanibacter lacteus]|uniref:acetoacetate--CoA ligase n=1 Tax=Taklimakanibacter lacteus TaxID=2268456 RepID=UPI003F68365F
MARFAMQNGFAADDYDTLHRWSVSEKGPFWKALWDFAGILGEAGDRWFVPDVAAPMTGAAFFPEASLNLAENLLKGPDRRVAVIAADETGGYVEISLRDLKARTARAANGLRAAGIGKGDAVGGILANRIDALVALLATAAIGAIWSSCSPDFGVPAILDRLGQIEPRALFVSPRYRYGGKEHDIADRISAVAAGMAKLRLVVQCGETARLALAPAIECVAMGDLGEELPLVFERVAFSHPLYVLYTSGTTGAPKAIVHSTGGVLLQHVKEHMLHGDVRPGDVLSWYTNTAWMMYHWLISGLACGAAVVLYDGAPVLKTSTGRDVAPLWRLAERAGITHFGTSPKYLATLADDDYRPKDQHDLSALRSVLSAGAPVSPVQFDWVYDNIKKDMIFASISGGTEIIGCFMLGSPLHCVRRGALTVKGLGLAVNVLDERNAPVIGLQGDLVCTEPFPSMPVTFWGKSGRERYHATYFAARPEIWTHGDVAEMTIHGSAVIYGRSDTTLKPGGVRIGTAEIYAACETVPGIEDCLVFGTPVAGDEEVVLCLKLKNGLILTPELASAIRGRIRDQASPRHVPHRIHVVREIPYTLNGKRVEGAARTVLQGGIVKNLGSLANAHCLDEYRNLDPGQAL